MLNTKGDKMRSHRLFLSSVLFKLVLHQCYCQDHYLLLCEGQTKDVSCPTNSTINVIRANYGFNGSNEEARRICDDWWNKYSPFRDTDNTDCHHPESTNILVDKCNRLPYCTITATNEIFGSPCRGTTKYFELFYNCNQDTRNNEDDYNDDDSDDDEDGSGSGCSSGDGDYGDDESDNDSYQFESPNLPFIGLSPIVVAVIAAGILVSLVIFVVILIFFLQIKRNILTHHKQSDGKGFKRNNLRRDHANVAFNLEYEIVEIRGDNPNLKTAPAKEQPLYESSIPVSSSNFAYSCVVESGPLRYYEPEGTYINQK